MRILTYLVGVLLALMISAYAGSSPAQADTELVASWYGPGFEGNLTASGDVFEPYTEYTAAHPYLPFGTDLLVCYSTCVVVEVTDRGPAAWTGRQLDLSYAAAEAIGLVYAGVGVVEVY